MKPTHHVQEPDQRRYIRDTLLRLLVEATDRGMRILRCSGVSFVTMGLGHWAEELAEIHGAATAQLLRALADIFDPSTTEAERAEAEQRRQEAVRDIHIALDLTMTPPAGTA